MRELLKGSLAHKVRLASTAAGVAMAVALLCGTLALSVSIDAAYRRAVTARHQGASVLVRAASPFTPTPARARAAAFDLAVAQARYDRVGRLDEIAVAPGPGVAVDDLRGRLQAANGAGYEAVGTDQAAGEDAVSSGALRFLAPGLLVFSAVALLV